MRARGRLRLVQAQGAYPTRAVKIVCGFPAGSSLDIITRIYAQKLEESLGQPFIVENRAGASGNVAAEAAVRSPARTATRCWRGITQAISMSLFQTVPSTSWGISSRSASSAVRRTSWS